MISASYRGHIYQVICHERCERYTFSLFVYLLYNDYNIVQNCPKHGHPYSSERQKVLTKFHFQ